MDKQRYWFFGSKLNTALLAILIILMIIALCWMYQDKERYWPSGMSKEARDWAEAENRAYEKGRNKILGEGDLIGWAVNSEQDNKVFYNKAWSYTREVNPSNKIAQYLFTLPSGNYINWAYTGQSCDDTSKFEYGTSASGCVNGWTAWLGVKDLRNLNTKEDLKDFGDFVLKNK